MSIPDHWYALCAVARAPTYPHTAGTDVYFSYKRGLSDMTPGRGGSVHYPVVLDEGELPGDLRHLQVMLVDDEYGNGQR